MKKTFLVAAALTILVVPAALAAPPAGKGKPENPGNSATAQQQSQSATDNAAQKCKALKKTDPTGFANLYGTKPNAHGKCVSSTVDNAAKKCKALRKNDPTGFATTYGTKPNAYGKCVSALAKKPA